tara:strand:+ start:18 stop:1280 length:1263 start_codon:yes stop_codon:yes gene_type:complete
MADSRFDVVELKSNNFARWRNDVQVALVIAQCSEAVEFEDQPDDIPDDRWLMITRNARAIILKALRDDYWRVSPGDSAFAILRTIREAFQPTSSLIAVMKLCKFFLLSQGIGNASDAVKEVTSAFAELQHALQASPVLVNTVVIDPSIRTAVLAFALEKSDPTAASQIKERFERNAISFEQAVSLLAEIRVTHRSSVTGNPVSVNAVEGKLCPNCSGHHTIEKCWFRDPSLAPERLKQKICTICKKIGHPTKNCPSRGTNAVSTSESAGSGNVPHFTFGVRHKVYTATTDSVPTIIVDSGATIHMMSDRTIFSKYESGPPLITNKVFTASGQSLPVTGHGSVAVQVPNLRTGVTHVLELTDVLHVPDLKENILSVSTLDKKGIEITTGNQKMILRHGGKFVASATLSEATSQYHLTFTKL